MTDRAIAYCGIAPTPAEFWSAWNLDPVLLAGLAALAVLIHRAAPRKGAAWAGFALAVVVFVSPLCNLSSALFSARVLHHVLLTAAIAPLLVIGFGLGAGRTLRLAQMGGLAAVIHAGAMWLFHAPPVYDWALQSVAGYWLMQAALGLSALWLWTAIISGPRGAGLGAAAISFVQMGMLGALIVFAASPLYIAHLFTTEPWGLGALADQQLAGLLMWVPAAGPYAAAIIWGIAQILRDEHSPEGARA
ncbi:MAG: cytochrome c oxidase assembly protein [Paracoccus sp. (in: a-proteobacteria)]|nr:cytochrome c oxidase assembly protein [Paracoccus sp. (in: a-proteobacteria)]